MKLRHALLGAAALLAAMPALAQEAPAIDPATLAAARDLMKAAEIDGQIKAMGPAMADAVDKQLKGMFAESKMPLGLQDEVSAIMRDYLSHLDRLYTPELIDQMAGIYARHFSAEDIKHLATMMQDPVMVRFRAQTPVLMGELMPIVMQAMKPQQDALVVKLRGTIADWMKAHPEDKAKLRQTNNS